MSAGSLEPFRQVFPFGCLSHRPVLLSSQKVGVRLSTIRHQGNKPQENLLLLLMSSCLVLLSPAGFRSSPFHTHNPPHSTPPTHILHFITKAFTTDLSRKPAALKLLRIWSKLCTLYLDKCLSAYTCILFTISGSPQTSHVQVRNHCIEFAL